MNRRRRFYFNGMLLTIVNLALKSVQLFFSAYISRAVGAEAVGLNTLIMTVYAFMLTFATSGIGLSVTRLVASSISKKEEGGVGDVMRGAFSYSFIFGSLATVVLFFFADVISDTFLHYSAASMSLRVLSLSLLPCAFGGAISGYFVGVRRVSRNAAVQVLGQLLRVSLTVAFIIYLKDRGVAYAVLGIALGATISEHICFIISLIAYSIDMGKRRRGGKGRLKEVSGIAFPLGVSSYIRSLLLTLEHSLIPKRLEKRGESVSEALSSYGTLHGMALPLVLYPMSPLSSFSGLLVPEFASIHATKQNERMKRIASESISTTLVYAIVCSVLLFLFSEELGYMVYDSYDAGRFIALLAPVIPIMYLDHVVDGILKGIGEHVFSMWVNILDSFLSVLLVFFLIPIMGISGYALVIVGMEVFNFSLSYVRLKSKIDFKISLAKSFVLPLCASVASALISNFVFNFSGKGASAFLFISKLVFSISSVVAIYTLIKLLFSRKQGQNVTESG